MRGPKNKYFSASSNIMQKEEREKSKVVYLSVLSFSHLIIDNFFLGSARFTFYLFLFVSLNLKNKFHRHIIPGRPGINEHNSSNDCD